MPISALHVRGENAFLGDAKAQILLSSLVLVRKGDSPFESGHVRAQSAFVGRRFGNRAQFGWILGSGIDQTAPHPEQRR